MRGVQFGTKHSYDDWGLLLKRPPVVSPPEPKTHYVDVPGADGALDLTEALTGAVQYKPRRIELEFVKVASRESWGATYMDILAALHGKRLEIVLDEDDQHTYTGRVTVGTPEWEKKWVTLKMEIEADPFKETANGRKVL